MHFVGIDAIHACIAIEGETKGDPRLIAEHDRPGGKVNYANAFQKFPSIVDNV